MYKNEELYPPRLLDDIILSFVLSGQMEAFTMIYLRAMINIILICSFSLVEINTFGFV